MRQGATSLLVISWILGSALTVSGAQLTLTKNGPVHVFYVDGESLNGAFDTIYFQAKATPPGAFANSSATGSIGRPRPAGQEFTYLNNMITADPDDFPGGLLLTRVGMVVTQQEVSFTAGKLGGTVTTANEPNGDLFLANLYIPNSSSAFTATVQLISAGTVVFEAVQTVPEPTGMVCGWMSLSALLAGRRLSRRAKQLTTGASQ